jgi:hypothetical protein
MLYLLLDGRSREKERKKESEKEPRVFFPPGSDPC